MNKLLIIDDDAGQANFLKSSLSSDFAISVEMDALKALAIIREIDFNAIVVDVHMPVIDGFDFIRKYRSQCAHPLPIFLLSSDKSYSTRIEALKLEIKDYLSPEMSKEELVIRINNHIHSNSILNNFLEYKEIKIDALSLAVSINNNKVEVTLTEYKLLKYFVMNNNKLLERELVKNSIWPNSITLDKTLNSHLTNIRAKISNSSAQIKSLKNEGIIFS